MATASVAMTPNPRIQGVTVALGLLGGRRGANLLAFFFHQLFKAGPALLPSLGAHRHAAFAFALAAIFARLGAATTLAAALIGRVTGVCFGRGASALASAGVVFAGPQALAQVDAAANV